MPIPPLDSDYLPSGIYDCTLEEIQETFGTNERRMELMEKLTQYLDNARSVGFSGWLIVNGSFITTEEYPGDIDVILIIGEDDSLLAPITYEKYKVISPEYARENFELHLLPTFADDKTTEEMISFFSRIRGKPNMKKGLLRVAI